MSICSGSGKPFPPLRHQPTSRDYSSCPKCGRVLARTTFARVLKTVPQHTPLAELTGRDRELYDPVGWQRSSEEEDQHGLILVIL